MSSDVVEDEPDDVDAIGGEQKDETKSTEYDTIESQVHLQNNLMLTHLSNERHTKSFIVTSITSLPITANNNTRNTTNSTPMLWVR